MLGTQVITVQSEDEWVAIRLNPRFQWYPVGVVPNVVGELYGMQVHVKEALCPVK